MVLFWRNNKSNYRLKQNFKTHCTSLGYKDSRAFRLLPRGKIKFCKNAAITSFNFNTLLERKCHYVELSLLSNFLTICYVMQFGGSRLLSF